MRPNIRISHELNGRVKDYAAVSGQSLSEAYREIIEAGLREVRREDGHRKVVVDEPATKRTAHGPVAREESLEEILTNVEFPASKDRDECIAAIEAARAYMEQNGSATMRELVANVMPEHPVGYAVPELKEGKRYRGAWWRRVVKPGLEALPSIEKPPTGASDWKYVGDE